MRRVLLALDRHGDMSAREIAEAAHVSEHTLTSGGYLTRLRNAGLIRISDWQRNSPGPFTPIYSISQGTNKRRPKPYSVAEKCRRWKERVGYYEEEYQQVKKARESIDHLLKITSIQHEANCINNHQGAKHGSQNHCSR
jgi:hypothetical protein